MSEAVALREADALPVWNPKQVVAQVNLIQQVMRDVMHKDEHYGTIPGTNKPTLLKPGAEKLCLTFRLAPTYDIIERDLGGGHREYRITCRLTSIQTGAVIGDGVGICSTMESKYRYRYAEAEDTNVPVPGKYWEHRKANEMDKMQEAIGGKAFLVKKNAAGQWTIHKKAAEKTENTDIADTFNTVLKMAKKRAMVDAAITATGASDIFTQDLEETVGPPKDVPPPPPAEPAPPKDVTPPPQKPTLLTVDEWTQKFAACHSEASLKVIWAGYYDIREQYDGEEQTAIMRAKDKVKVALMAGTAVQEMIRTEGK